MANVYITIQHKDKIYKPPVEEDIQLEWERTGSPGKITFSIIKSNIDGTATEYVPLEGDVVRLHYDGKVVFLGYIFTISRDKESLIKITAYDQIRYLKNKFSYVFENKTATQIIKAICDDYSLDVGSMDNTKYVFSSVTEENTALLDIIMTVLDDTLLNTGEMYVLYDNAGKLYLKNVLDMIVTPLIDNETAENFDYSSSIDDETYNSILLYYKDEDSKKIQAYTASSAENINQWGILQYFEEVDTPTNAQLKAKQLLELYNRKTRELKITGAFGHIDVRGGSLIPVKLDLGDVKTNNYMIVSKVTHKFNKDHHTMDITVEGAWDK